MLSLAESTTLSAAPRPSPVFRRVLEPLVCASPAAASPTWPSFREVTRHGAIGASAGALLGVPLGVSARLLTQVLCEGRRAFDPAASLSFFGLAKQAVVRSSAQGAVYGAIAGFACSLVQDEAQEAAVAACVLAATSAATAGAGLLAGAAVGEASAQLASWIAPRVMHPHMLSSFADSARIGFGLTGAALGLAAPLGALVVCGGV